MKKLNLLSLLTVATIGGSILPITVSCNKGDEPVADKYKVKFIDCEGIEVPETKTIEENKQYKVTIKAKKDYVLVDWLIVKVNNNNAASDYYSFDIQSEDLTTGVLTIPKVKADTTISVKAVIPHSGATVIGEVELNTIHPEGVEIVVQEQQELIYDTLKAGDKFEISLVDDISSEDFPNGKYGFVLPLESPTLEIIPVGYAEPIELFKGQDYNVEITNNYTHVTFTLLKTDKFYNGSILLRNFKLKVSVNVVEAYIHMAFDANGSASGVDLNEINCSIAYDDFDSAGNPTLVGEPINYGVDRWLTKEEAIIIHQNVQPTLQSGADGIKLGFVISQASVGSGSEYKIEINYLKCDGEGVQYSVWPVASQMANKDIAFVIDPSEPIGHDYEISVNVDLKLGLP